jgi:hypothetical protein
MSLGVLADGVIASYSYITICGCAVRIGGSSTTRPGSLAEGLIIEPTPQAMRYSTTGAI